MVDRSELVPAIQHLHAAIGDGRFVDRDPHPHDAGAQRVVEKRVVLVPGFFTAAARRLEQRHVLEQAHVAFEQVPADRADPLAQRDLRQPILIRHEIVELAHRIIALLRAHLLDAILIALLIGHT